MESTSGWGSSPVLTIWEASKDWIFFIDCDAFFTDFDTSIVDLLATHMASMTSQAPGDMHFLVAEDPGGINTGVFLIRHFGDCDSSCFGCGSSGLFSR